jgi:hypothetical protein
LAETVMIPVSNWSTVTFCACSRNMREPVMCQS